MSIYTVHRRPEDKSDDVVLVGEGFSWAAFAFTALWALAKRMWLVALILVSLLALIAAIAAALHLGEGMAAVLQIAVSTIFAFEAHNIRRWTLTRAGYEEIATVSGNTAAEAELAYFCEIGPEPFRRRTTDSAAHDTLGLFGNLRSRP
jgi:hypothetical protein